MKAVALLSGGLDSSLAIKLILQQGIDVVAVNFVTPFCLCDRKTGCKKESILISEKLNIELKIFNISDEYLEIIKKPKYGYGKNLNPCIDCRILMFKKAKEFMNNINANFIITGEVIGQRPMSQNRKAIEIIEKESGLEGLIVRPLSGKLLPKTIPEQNGWINRNNLLDISGRSRKKQFNLASEFNISGYACPAGGCLLTDPTFSLRIKDMLNSDMLTIHNINLFKNGRYFRISNSFKLAVGRNQHENQKLISMIQEGDIIIEPETIGPTAIGRGKIENDQDIYTASEIVAYYCKKNHNNITINYKIFPESNYHKIIINKKIPESELLKFKIEKDS